MLPRIYVVRHGETEWSRSGRHTGRTEVPLTAHGEEQARKLKQCFLGLRFARVLTSPRRRAQRTCEEAAVETTAEIEPDLAEWDYGDYEGKDSTEILTVRPDWNLFHDGCPNGESPAQISGRANRLIARLRLLQGNVALFTHGHFGRVLGVRWVGLPVEQAAHFLFETASFNVLDYEHDRHDRPVIAQWNSSAHGASTDIRTGDAGTIKRRALERS